MANKKPITEVLWILLLAGAWIAPQAWAQDQAPRLEVTYIDVGQGDAILIRCPEGTHYLLIDSGDTRYPGSSDAFRSHLRQEFQDKPQPWTITLAVASHPHADHIGSMQWVLENFDVETYVDNGQKYDSATFGRLNKLRRKLVEEGKLDYISGSEFGFGSVDFCPLVKVSLLVPWALESLSDTNDRSVMVRVDFEDTSFLFVGDAEEPAEEILLHRSEEESSELDVDVLKAGHHGSHTSSTADFVAAVSPDVVVISCGKKGVGTNRRYKHPRWGTVKRFSNWFKNHDRDRHPLDGRVWAFDGAQGKWRQHRRREQLWVTPKDGSVTLVSDGQTFAIQTEEGAPQTFPPP